VQKQATAVMLEQLTCATASVRQLVTTQLEAWEWGKSIKERKKKKVSSDVKIMALFLAWNETYHMWGNP